MSIKIVRMSKVLGLLTGLMMLSSQTLAALKIHLDCVSFMKDETHSDVVLYYQITSDRSQPSLKFDWDLDMKLNILKADTAWISREWEQKVPIEGTANQETGLTYIGRISFQADEDAYQAELSVKDKTFNGESDSVLAQFRVQFDKNPKPVFSDILFASSIQNENPENSENPFLRNGFLVMPKPDGVYRQSDPGLFYYVEIYNLLKKSAPQDYLFQSVITKSDGAAVKKSKIKKYPKALIQNAMSTYEALEIAGIDTGFYQLQISLYDSNRLEIAHQSKRFSVGLNPDTAASSGRTMATIPANSIASMSPEDFEEQLSALKYILNGNEKSVLKSMKDDEAKRRFFYNYWFSKDVTRSTFENGFYQQHMQRVQTANLNFGKGFTKGWKTDRGRIYIQYGQPDNIERFHSSVDRIPYETWIYDNIENGVEFVFADLEGNSNYSLIHSTKIGETYNPNYESLLRRSEGSANQESE